MYRFFTSEQKKWKRWERASEREQNESLQENQYVGIWSASLPLLHPLKDSFWGEHQTQGCQLRKVRFRETRGGNRTSNQEREKNWLHKALRQSSLNSIHGNWISSGFWKFLKGFWTVWTMQTPESPSWEIEQVSPSSSEEDSRNLQRLVQINNAHLIYCHYAQSRRLI